MRDAGSASGCAVAADRQGPEHAHMHRRLRSPAGSKVGFHATFPRQLSRSPPRRPATRRMNGHGAHMARADGENQDLAIDRRAKNHKETRPMEMIMSMTFSAPGGARHGRAGPGSAGLGAILKGWWMAYLTGRIEQAAIAHLSSMSDRELKDIGLMRSRSSEGCEGCAGRPPVQPVLLRHGRVPDQAGTAGTPCGSATAACRRAVRAAGPIGFHAPFPRRLPRWPPRAAATACK